ncbi:MAG: hypothetical protein ACLP7A_03205 [Desulfobaccales bacterium]
MDKKIIFLILAMFWLVVGFPTDHVQRAYAYPVGESADCNACMGFEPVKGDSGALPNVQYPFTPEAAGQYERPREYTGIIKNKSNCDVSLYSRNSDATLIIPAHSWIEYSAWVRHFPVTAYCEGKPFYCLNICANPNSYPFMCKNYDFMVEIPGGREGRQGYPGKKLKRRVRKLRAVG